MQDPKVELAADLKCALGECPVWHPNLAVLFFSDIDNERVYRYEPRSRTVEVVFEGKKVGGITLEHDGALLFLLAGGEIARWSPESGLEEVFPGLNANRDTRFNDAIADPDGHVISGTMQSPMGRGVLYRFEKADERSVLLHDLGCPNGMGFSPDLIHFYFTDSSDRTIYRFAWNSGASISHREKFIECPPAEGVPDGMAVDAEGCIWSARWGGAAVVRHAPDGSVRQRISLPAQNVTSVAFGGPDRTDLYITSAGGEERSVENPLSGSLFRIQTSIPGTQPFRSRFICR